MKTRPMVRIRCARCKKWHKKFRHHVRTGEKIGSKFYCSQKCRDLAQRTGTTFKCATCQKNVWKTPAAQRSKSGNYFCSKHCATIYNNSHVKIGKNHPNYTNGCASYRELALKTYGAKCAKCSYNVRRILEVHHIDGNRDNNSMPNLIVLCPTHHREITLRYSKV